MASFEQAWVCEADGVRWLIPGDGVEPEFRLLATAWPPHPRCAADVEVY